MAITYNVQANGHLGGFKVSATPGNEEQLVFVGSHPGVSWTPVGRDRVLAYVTVTNTGPRAVRVFWDGTPPSYRQPTAPVQPVPTSPGDQFAVILPNNSTTMVVGRAVKVVYAPELDPADTGDSASGDVVVSWCCPPVWNVQAASAPPGSFVGLKSDIPPAG